MSTATATTDEHPRARRSACNSRSPGCPALRAPTGSNRRSTSLPGVRASVNFATRVATIDANEDTQAAALCEAVQRAGYQAELRRPGGAGRSRSRRRSRAISADPAGGRGRALRALGRPVGDVRRRAQHPLHRLGVGADRAGRPGRDLGGLAVPPSRDTQRAPPRRLHGDPHLGRYHRCHDLVALHRLRRSRHRRAQGHLAGTARKRRHLLRGRRRCDGVRAGGAVLRGPRQIKGRRRVAGAGGAEREGRRCPAARRVGDGHPGRRAQESNTASWCAPGRRSPPTASSSTGRPPST